MTSDTREKLESQGKSKHSQQVLLRLDSTVERRSSSDDSWQADAPLFTHCPSHNCWLWLITGPEAFQRRNAEPKASCRSERMRAAQEGNIVYIHDSCLSDWTLCAIIALQIIVQLNVKWGVSCCSQLSESSPKEPSWTVNYYRGQAAHPAWSWNPWLQWLLSVSTCPSL